MTEAVATGDGTTGMARGGRATTRTEPERRCIAGGGSGPTARLIRFVLDPEGGLVPDLQGRLPGRGAWLTADRALVAKAVRKGLFARAFRQPVAAPPDLAERLEAMLAQRLVELIGLARKAGQAVTGFEKTRARLLDGRAGLLLTAADAGADGRAKLAGLAGGGLPHVELLDSGELGLAFGRDFAIHAALDAGGIADRVLIEAERLSGLRGTSARETESRLQAGPAGN